MSYLDAILQRKPVGQKVAVIGAGGIGFDVSEFITHAGGRPASTARPSGNEWGIDTALDARGGIARIKAEASGGARGVPAAAQEVQGRRRPGQDHRLDPPYRSEEQERADAQLGRVPQRSTTPACTSRIGEGEPQLLPVDTVIVCAGQDPLRELQEGLEAAGQKVHLIGGADVACRAGRQARDQPGLAPRRRTLIDRRPAQCGAFLWLTNNKEKPMSTDLQLQPAAAASLQRWHQFVAAQDLSPLPELLHLQAVFRSPMAHNLSGRAGGQPDPQYRAAGVRGLRLSP